MKTTRFRITIYWIGYILFILGFILYFYFVKAPTYKRMLTVQQKSESEKASGVKSIEKPINLKEFIKEEAPIDIILLLDQSGSMKKMDPGNTRVRACEYVINNIAAKSSGRVFTESGLWSSVQKLPGNTRFLLLKFLTKKGQVLPQRD